MCNIQISVPRKNGNNLQPSHTSEAGNKPDNKHLKIDLDIGSTTIIIGANGSGKTKLSVYIEDTLGIKAHRISAHRALNLNPQVNKIPEEKAKQLLLLGEEWVTDIRQRKNARWGGQSSTRLLDDFSKLLQYLFAQQNNIAVKEHHGEIQRTQTKFDLIKNAWEEILPHRKLHISADDMEVSGNDIKDYSASQMSDGERAIFYILGQVMAADQNTLLIFDEPELHIHRAIISNLWDKIETLRPDCSFLIITHDIEFAATRIAKKYVIKNYFPDPAWDIYEIPDNNFDEETISIILGSRKPILFIEGNKSSLDVDIYRSCYPEWTVISKGSCKDVIQSVSSLNKLNSEQSLLNIKCAGIVDRDTRDANEISKLNELGIKVLPVSEIENLFILNDIAKEILRLEGFRDSELEIKLTDFQGKLITFIQRELQGNKLDEFITKCLYRKIDNFLKNIDLSGKVSQIAVKEKLSLEFKYLIEGKLENWFSEIKQTLENSIKNNDLDTLLTIYENKGLLAEAASYLKNTRRDMFEKWLIRNLRIKNQDFINAIKRQLPEFTLED